MKDKALAIKDETIYNMTSIASLRYLFYKYLMNDTNTDNNEWMVILLL